MILHPLEDLPGHVECKEHRLGGRQPWTCPRCPSAPAAPARAPSPKRGARGQDVEDASRGTPGRSWSQAKATDCLAGHNHPSKMEARVCNRLSSECAEAGSTLFRNVRMPLLSIASRDTGTPLYLTVDFGIVVGGRLSRLVDAKAKGRVSRDWKRGARACESAWGIKVEEVEA